MGGHVGGTVGSLRSQRGEWSHSAVVAAEAVRFREKRGGDINYSRFVVPLQVC